jgi:hypothetical protein
LYRTLPPHKSDLLAIRSAAIEDGEKRDCGGLALFPALLKKD